MTSEGRTLLCIEIRTPDDVWNRALVSDYIPSQHEFDVYYKTLCGFTNATVVLNKISIPNNFNTSLLSVSEHIPTVFPVHDLHTHPRDVEKREKYEQFIRQVCDMERSRASLCVFTNTTSTGTGGASFGASFGASSGAGWDTSRETERVRSALLNKRAWVRELLSSLAAETDDICETTEIVAVAPDATVIHAWIITPAAADVRAEFGSKLIMDSKMGKEWEHMLGTSVFPDFVVSRRLSTLSWAFQHVASDTMIRSMLDWYIVSQDATVADGVSSWIYGADRELGVLMSTFKKVKVNERLLPAASTDGIPNIFKLLSTIESQLLASQHEFARIAPIPAELFRRYIHYVCRALKIPKEAYQGVEMVSQILQRWERGSLGFKSASAPLITAWNEVWGLCMGEIPTLERVLHFVRTLDAWDPVEAMVFSHAQKSAIANEWITIYIENEMVADTKARVRSTNLHVRVKEWCTKYVPDTVFPTYFTPMTIGPVFTRHGYNSIKQPDGRHTHGVRYRVEEYNAQEIPPPVEKKPRKNARMVPSAQATAQATNASKPATPVLTTATIHIGSI